MTFGEKVKELRVQAKLSQREVAEKLGITTRAYQSYELNNVTPKKRDVLMKISELYNISVDQLLSEEDLFYIDVREQYGSRGSEQAQRILKDTQAYLAGGDLTSEDREAFMESLMRMFLKSKELAKEKYGKNTKE